MTSLILSRSVLKSNISRFTSLSLSLIMIFSAFGPGIFPVREAHASSNLPLVNPGFDSSGFSGWTPGSKWNIDTHNYHSSPKSAQVDEDTGSNPDALTQAISTLGYNNLSLSYWYKVTDALGSTDYVKVQWSVDGTTWNTLRTISNVSAGGWIQKTDSIPSGADNNAGFRIRFLANLRDGGTPKNKDHDTINFDDIALSGDLINGNITVTKVVVNDGGGNATVQDFPLFVDQTAVVSGQSNQFAPGQYTVSETTQSNYTGVFSGDCDLQGVINIGAGENKNCTITNTYTPPATPEISLTKSVVYNSANQSATYTINWGVSDADVSDLTITDTLPAWTDGGVNSISLTPNPVILPGGLNFDQNNPNDKRTITWNLGPQVAGSSGQITFKVELWAGQTCEIGANKVIAVGTYGNDSVNKEAFSDPIEVDDAHCDEPKEEPENSCLVPMVGAEEKIFTFGSSAPELSLQQILTNNAYSINVSTDETGYKVWNVPNGTASVTFTATFIESIAGNTNNFGYYTDSDLSSFTPVTYGVPTVVDTTSVSSIGFAVESVGDSTSEYATERSLNGGDDHAVIYNPEDNTYVIAFEDKPLNVADKDYNDLVVEVTIDSCREVSLVCEPGKELIVNGSFEDPVVTDGANWDVFTSVLGWDFNWMNPNDAPESLELHRGVNGWLSADGLQHVELDGDWTGPGGGNGESASTRLWQDIPTVNGKNYEVKFSFKPRPGALSNAQNTLGILWGGNQVDELNSDDTTGNDWTAFTYQVTADSALSRLQFEDRGTSDSLGTFLDNVSVMCLEDCRPTEGSIVSGENTRVTDIDGAPMDVSAVSVTSTNIIDTYWTADDNGDFGSANWMWSEDPVQGWTVDKVVTFEEDFTIDGNPASAQLFVAADNDYEVFVNGTSVGTNAIDDQGHVAPAGSYLINPSILIDGLNTLKVVVINEGQAGDAINNPGGVIYKLSWTTDCGDTPPPPQEKDFDVHVYKYVDGQSVTGTDAEFMVDVTVNDVGGTTLNLNSSNQSDVYGNIPNGGGGKIVMVEEKVGSGQDTLPIGSQCEVGKFVLLGYSYGTSLPNAQGATMVETSNVDLGQVSVDQHVIVWNEKCPTPPDECDGDCDNGPQRTTLTIKKIVIDDDNVGLNKSPADFTLSVTAVNPSQNSVIGDETGITITLEPGEYKVTEVDPLGYGVSYEGCSGTISLGESRICTVTNNDIAPEGRSSFSGARSSGGGGSASDEPGEVAGALIEELPGLPNTGNGEKSQALMIVLSLIFALVAVNVAGIKLSKAN